jgi:hypothetical protein
MRLDLLIASASAGLLVYSGRLLVPTARLRPDDIIAYKYLPGLTYSIGPMLGAGMIPWPVFPEDDIMLRIGGVLDGKVGFDLLIYGTIGSVLTVIAGAVALSWNVPLAVDIASVPAAGAVGYGAGWWWTEHSGWYGKRERRLLVHCFLAWLERAVGDPRAKGYEFDLTVVSTARNSGFSQLGDLLVDMGLPRTAAEDEAAARRIVALARQHHYRWRGDDFRKWARKITTEGSG